MKLIILIKIWVRINARVGRPCLLRHHVAIGPQLLGSLVKMEYAVHLYWKMSKIWIHYLDRPRKGFEILKFSNSNFNRWNWRDPLFHSIRSKLSHLSTFFSEKITWKFLVFFTCFGRCLKGKMQQTFQITIPEIINSTYNF